MAVKVLMICSTAYSVFQMPFTVTSTLVCCELIKAGYLHIDLPGDPVGFLLRVPSHFRVQLGFDRLYAAVSVLGMYLYVGYIICLLGWSPGRRHCSFEGTQRAIRFGFCD